MTLERIPETLSLNKFEHTCSQMLLVPCVGVYAVRVSELNGCRTGVGLMKLLKYQNQILESAGMQWK